MARQRHIPVKGVLKGIKAGTWPLAFETADGLEGRELPERVSWHNRRLHRQFSGYGPSERVSFDVFLGA